MLGTRQETARLQSDFYRDYFRKIVRWLILSMAIIFFLILLIIYQLLFQPSQRYYANTTEGKILSIQEVKK